MQSWQFLVWHLHWHQHNWHSSKYLSFLRIWTHRSFLHKRALNHIFGHVLKLFFEFFGSFYEVKVDISCQISSQSLQLQVSSSSDGFFFFWRFLLWFFLRFLLWFFLRFLLWFFWRFLLWFFQWLLLWFFLWFFRRLFQFFGLNANVCRVIYGNKIRFWDKIGVFSCEFCLGCSRYLNFL